MTDMADIAAAGKFLVVEANRKTLNAVAQDPKAPLFMLKSLSANNHGDIRRLVAQHPNTPPETLISMAKDEKLYVREAIATNHKTPIEALVLLSKDPHERVRQLVAKHRRASPNIIHRLMKDEEAWVRFAAITNPNLPEKEQRKLAESPNLKEREGIAANPSAPIDVLLKLCKHTRGADYCLVRSPYTPKSILHSLHHTRRTWIKSIIAHNPNVAIDTLESLAVDKDPSVRREAKVVLGQKKAKKKRR